MFLHFGSSLKTLLRALEVGPGSQPPFQKWWFLLDDVANPYFKNRRTHKPTYQNMVVGLVLI